MKSSLYMTVYKKNMGNKTVWQTGLQSALGISLAHRVKIP